MSARPRFFLLPAISVAHRVSTVAAEEAGGNGAGSRDELPAGSGSGVAGWRLLGGNNRELGCSARAYPLDQIYDAILHLQNAGPHLSMTVSPTARGTWFWAADLRGQRVAISSRSYGRQRECRYNAGQFLRALPLAVAVAAIPQPDLVTTSTSSGTTA